MNKKFNLSEKMYDVDCGMEEFFKKKDVKEFIKRLKEGRGVKWDGSFISVTNFRLLIDKLAGDDLK